MEEHSNPAVFSLPRYEQLPDIGLYMDQVIALTDRSLESLFGQDASVLTASMVNNYVKQRLLLPPVKKRYSRKHVACLIVICTLKQVLSIPEISVLLNELLADDDFAQRYNEWCALQEQAFAELAGANRSRAHLAAISVAGKRLFQKTVQNG